MTLPAQDLRSNIGTWAVLPHQLPVLAHRMVHALPTEQFDPNFQGQYLETTYFDSRDFSLWKARRKGRKYLTLRIRCYSPPYDPGSPRRKTVEAYTLSAKTEGQKFRQMLPVEDAEAILYDPTYVFEYLSADLIARYQELTGGAELTPMVTLCCRRYAVENQQDRLTLDVNIHTSNGKHYPSSVLEFKSTTKDATTPLVVPGVRIKLSKWLWAMS